MNQKNLSRRESSLVSSAGLVGMVYEGKNDVNMYSLFKSPHPSADERRLFTIAMDCSLVKTKIVQFRVCHRNPKLQFLMCVSC